MLVVLPLSKAKIALLDGKKEPFLVPSISMDAVIRVPAEGEIKLHFYVQRQYYRIYPSIMETNRHSGCKVVLYKSNYTENSI